ARSAQRMLRRILTICATIVVVTGPFVISNSLLQLGEKVHMSEGFAGLSSPHGSPESPLDAGDDRGRDHRDSGGAPPAAGPARADRGGLGRSVRLARLSRGEHGGHRLAPRYLLDRAVSPLPQQVRAVPGGNDAAGPAERGSGAAARAGARVDGAG